LAMKNPCHPGEIVAAALEDLGLSVTAAAEQLGVSRKTLSELVNKRAGVSAEMAMRLEKGIGSSADAWMRMQAAYDLARFRAAQRALDVKPLTPA
jgi:addiction module HigA family antidote